MALGVVRITALLLMMWWTIETRTHFASLESPLSASVGHIKQAYNDADTYRTTYDRLVPVSALAFILVLVTVIHDTRLIVKQLGAMGMHVVGLLMCMVTIWVFFIIVLALVYGFVSQFLKPLLGPVRAFSDRFDSLTLNDLKIIVPNLWGIRVEAASQGLATTLDAFLVVLIIGSVAYGVLLYRITKRSE